NFEGFQQLLGLSYDVVTPDVNARAGLLPCSSVITLPDPCNASTPLTNVTTVSAPIIASSAGARPYLALYPLPNGAPVLTSAGLPTGTGHYLSSPTQTIREDFGTARFDHSFSNSDSFSSVYTI